MKRLYYLDKLGWPVVRIKGRWFLNFLRILIHTRKYTFKKPHCLMTSQDKLIERQKQFEKLLLSQEDINDITVECAEFYGNVPMDAILLDLQVAVAVAMQRSHAESLEDAGYRSEPNALTRETIEKSERCEDVKSFDTVEEMFEDLDK